MEIRRDFEHGIVNRTQNSIFSYQGWPSVCRDESGNHNAHGGDAHRRGKAQDRERAQM